MGAVAAPVDEMTPRQEGFDLAGRERVTGFDRGFAGHHVENLVQEFLMMEVKGFLFAALEEFSKKIKRVEAVEETREGMNADRAGPHRRRFNAEAVQQRLNLFEQFLLSLTGWEREGNQKPLAFERASRDSCEQIFRAC